jgi:hypothetical protein
MIRVFPGVTSGDPPITGVLVRIRADSVDSREGRREGDDYGSAAGFVGASPVGRPQGGRVRS